MVFRQPVALFCIVVYACLLIVGAAEDLRTDSSIFEMFWLSENYGIALLVRPLIFPVAVVSSYCAERHNHFDLLIMLRMGEKKYCAFRVFTYCFIGILLYSLSTLIFGLVLSMTAHGNRKDTIERLVYFFGQETMWSRLAEKAGYWVSFFLYILINALPTGISILLAICVAALDWNKYVIYTVPFLLGRIGSFFDGSPVSFLFYSPFGRELQPDGGIAVCLLRNITASFILGYLFYKEICWRKSHG